jgi:hypothetical protein
MKDESKHIMTLAGLIALGGLAVGSSKSSSGGESAAASATPSPPAPTASATAATAATTANPGAAAPAAGGYDAIGTERTWAELHATLKEASAAGNIGKVALLLKNDGDEEEKISSILYFHATNQEGDNGDLDIIGGYTSCDGAVPPKGIFKCKLAFKFDTAPKEMTIRVGAGIVSDTTYFKVKLGK